MMVKMLKGLSRFVLGLVFIYSGFVKAVDPLGSAYKFGDYFTAFGMDFFEVLALPLGLFLSSFEMVLGMALLLSWRKRIINWLVLGFMAFFTVLTLILALFNPVSDCGCFGDALILTNWQTFLKNVVLMFFVFLLIWPDGLRQREKPCPRHWILLVLVYMGALGFSFWNYQHLPLVDFRPYKVGTVVSEAMEIPPDAPVDQYESILVYRNLQSGEEKEFSIENYPRDTTAWAFASSSSRLLKKGYEPPIHDFAIMDMDGYDIVDRILADPGYSLLLLSYDLEKADEESLQKAAAWYGLEQLAGDFSFYAVSASTTEKVKEMSASLDLPYTLYAGDEIMLKTIVRSNPGFMLIHSGSIVGKWAYRDFPQPGEVHEGIDELLERAMEFPDEETRLLMEAGVYEPMNYNMVEFADLLPGLIYNPLRQSLENRILGMFIIGVSLVLLLLLLLEKRNKL